MHRPLPPIKDRRAGLLPRAQAQPYAVCHESVVLGLDPRTQFAVVRGNGILRVHAREPTSRTLYIGVTGDLVRRVWEHKQGAVPGFVRRYGLGRLVWFEVFDDVTAAIQREKTLKHWLRAWKIALIERSNPTWRNLYDGIAA
jgi:putative endonuclease